MPNNKSITTSTIEIFSLQQPLKILLYDYLLFIRFIIEPEILGLSGEMLDFLEFL